MDCESRRLFRSIPGYRGKPGPERADRRPRLRRAQPDSTFCDGVPRSACVTSFRCARVRGRRPLFAGRACPSGRWAPQDWHHPSTVGDLEPHQFKDHGRLVTGSICGEFLTKSRQNGTLAPALAVSWRRNADATQSAFNLRRGVKFAIGTPFTADDVITTFNRLTDPNFGSEALSAFKGVLSPGGAKKVGDFTVVFYLEAPNANFPYLTSSTTYQAIILPSAYKLGSFAKGQTTGPFNLVSYTPGVGARFDRNPHLVGGQRSPRRRRRDLLLRGRRRCRRTAGRPDRHDEPDQASPAARRSSRARGCRSFPRRAQATARSRCSRRP